MIEALTEKNKEDLGITVLKRVHRLMPLEGQWSLKHVPRGKNLLADRMEKLGLNWRSSLQTFDLAPNDLGELIQQESTCGFVAT